MSFRGSRLRLVGISLVMVVLFAGAAMAQRRFFGRQRGREIDVQNQPYDGRFTFAARSFDW